MTPELTTTEQMIYTAYRANHGEVAAERWLKGYLTRRKDSSARPTSKQPPFISLEAPERPVRPSEEVIRKEPTATPLCETVESFSARMVALLEGVRPTARRIYAFLHRYGCLFITHHQGSLKANQVSYFLPAELVQHTLGICKGSFYRSLLELKRAGLVDARGHCTTINGWNVRKDGTVWCVKLTPTRGKSARLSFEDLKAQYRDLEADIEAGRTVWMVMRQSYSGTKGEPSFELLLPWSLSLVARKTPLTMTVAQEPSRPLEALVDLFRTRKHERREAVEALATTCAITLGDMGNVSFYQYLLWQLLRLSDQRRDYSQMVYYMLVRARTDLREGFARRAGALFVSRLKASAIWEEVRGVPPLRVAA